MVASHTRGLTRFRQSADTTVPALNLKRIC